MFFMQWYIVYNVRFVHMLKDTTSEVKLWYGNIKHKLMYITQTMIAMFLHTIDVC